MGEVERLLTECGVPKYYPRFSKANILTFDVMQARRALLPALIDNPDDLRRVLSALGERGSSFEGQPHVDDEVMTELREWSAKIRARLRDLARKHADQLVSRVAPFRARANGGGGGVPSKVAVTAINAKVDKAKMLLNACNGAMKAHQRFMELSRLMRKSTNKAGDPTRMEATQKQLDEFESYVKQVLVMLNEEGKRDLDHSQLHRDAAAGAAAAPADDADDDVSGAAAAEAAATAAKQEVARLRDDNAHLVRRLERAMAAVAESEMRRLRSEDALRDVVLRSQRDALAANDAFEDELLGLRAATEAHVAAITAGFEAQLSEQRAAVAALERQRLEREAEIEKLRWCLASVEGGAAVLLDEVQFRGDVVVEKLRAELQRTRDEILVCKGDVGEARLELKAVHDANDGLLAELGAAKVDAEEVRAQLATEREARAADVARLEHVVESEIAARKAVELDKEKLGRAVLDRRAESEKLEKLVALAQGKVATLEATIAAARVQTAEVECQTLTHREWVAMMDSLREPSSDSDGVDGSGSAGAAILDGTFPPDFRIDAAELRDCLRRHGVPKSLATLHVGALARRAEELTATAAAVHDDGAATEAAANALELLRAQLHVVMGLDEGHPNQQQQAESGGGGAQVRLATAHRASSLAAGPAVLSHLLRESWELVEAAAGFRMPLTRGEAVERNAAARRGDGEAVRSLEDDLLGTQDELLRIVRALRSAAWCYGTAAGAGGTAESAAVTTASAPQVERDPAPMEIMGQRRE